MRDHMDKWVTPPQTGYLTYLGFPHLHVNRPLALQPRRNFQVSKRSALESLNKDDDDGNDNGKKAKTFRLAKQKLLHVYHAFW